ncbi:hypothetical protein A3B32_01760 [Candidatus Uhrbacteria bacterium RIFCSPLOWO2_01_FULL_53_9]|uniref:Vancomycin resistance protein n=3 Tax=Candidatus Uhriibacteriota TaxID=1752732 RepID=A0A1F7V0H4_9BACT|nr:MAG: hypothetical protein A3C17_01795 [Candidatus Uhrbacteria bacterium RIFCSPHIGHO2_02_FULL_53_13]OGL83514.1 MAG: hypothetical protein A3B32_01760 [Candidatus Uhrbacteria bacterium RIFCSPLOWO2_01_FULL_53_9]OGL89207.1 MAG: hypothetical protein A3I45_01200 [Candidatus Uhrbacteria bacterium RIFCSPLOWO2_02_FULL_53_10]
MEQSPRSVHRSWFRKRAGHLFYTLKRRAYWRSPHMLFASCIEDPLTFEIASHQTPLRRCLKDVDAHMQENKIINLRLAIAHLNGLVIDRGETFSYWRQIGNPTRGKGYVEGMILREGLVHSGVGGGLCQLSNLIYWMTLHTPLCVVERWHHGYDVFPDVDRRQPFGSGATCSYPNIDLQIKNDTDQRFQLSLHLTDTHLVGAWRSDRLVPYEFQIVEKNHRFTSTWCGGYVRCNTLFRRWTERSSGHVVQEELVAKNQARMMYNPLLQCQDGQNRV